MELKPLEAIVEPFGMETILRRNCGGPCGRLNVPVVQFTIDSSAPPGFGKGWLCADCLVDLANEVAFANV